MTSNELPDNPEKETIESIARVVTSLLFFFLRFSFPSCSLATRGWPCCNARPHVPGPAINLGRLAAPISSRRRPNPRKYLAKGERTL